MPGEYYNGPREFVLSHYHADHYRGLMAAAQEADKKDFTWAPEFVYMPGLPKFKRNAEFYMALFSMSAIAIGDDTGSIDFDFLKAVRSLREGVVESGHEGKFKYRPLFQGDIFFLGGQSCVTLWPPKSIDDNAFSLSVEKALEKFHVALNSDELLREIYSHIVKSEFVSRLTEGESGERYYRNFHDIPDIVCERLERPDRRLLPVVEEANKSLRTVANHLSAGFVTEGSMLFLGDIAERALPAVVDKLASLGELNFKCVIAPHHGTYWDKSLFSIRADTVIVSTGKRLAANYRPQWGSVGKTVLSSFLNRDIHLGI